MNIKKSFRIIFYFLSFIILRILLPCSAFADHFTILPYEIKDMIFDYLPKRSIVSMRGVNKISCKDVEAYLLRRRDFLSLRTTSRVILGFSNPDLVKKIERIDCQECRLKSNSFFYFLNWINPKITENSFSRLQNFSNLSSLNIDTHLSPNDMESMAEALPHLSQLHVLSLKRAFPPYKHEWKTTESYSHTKSVMAVAENLPFLPRLESLEVVNYEIGSKGVSILAIHLNDVSDLKILTLDFVMLKDLGAINLAHNLYHVPCLEELSLRYNWFSNEGLREIAKNLKYVHSLKKLNLTGNTNLQNGLVDLANCFSSLPQLRELMLGDMHVSWASILMMCRNLPELISLETLGFSMDAPNYREVGYYLYPAERTLIQNQIEALGMNVEIVEAPVSPIHHSAMYLTAFYGLPL